MAAAPDALLLAGPTASGKSEWALRLAQRWPVEIISVDSAQVYRGMDIGTAKPSAAQRAQVPHHLLDLRDPADTYSAGDFVADALQAIGAIRARGRLPLLVGGTMLYFRALVHGLAQIPVRDPQVRAELDAAAAAHGWPAMHARLVAVDPQAAARMTPSDSQRIQRALEVHAVTGRTITEWQQATAATHGLRFARWALVPAERAVLHERIAARFDAMMAAGLLAEVAGLRQRADLDARTPALRAVGYRQLWAHLSGELELPQAVVAAVAATRQLAKRQLTWIRSDPDWTCIDPLQPGALEKWLEDAMSIPTPSG
jgi:tRNA dimethylallyltransferase